MREVLGRFGYRGLATVSNGHVYNLRGSRTYVAPHKVRLKTQAAPVGIGLPPGAGTKRQAGLRSGRHGPPRRPRRREGPVPDQPRRSDHAVRVHRRRCRYFRAASWLPLLEGLLLSFPFPIRGFHADHGSEYINHRVAELLNKLHIGGNRSVVPVFRTRSSGRATFCSTSA